MRKAFQNSSQLQCVFTDEGVTFGSVQQNVYFPYGCLDQIRMSLLGVLQANCGKRICSFVVDHKDRAEMKEMIRYAREAGKTAPKAEPQLIDLSKLDEASRVSPELPPEEQLRQYKALFVQGVISKEAYDAQKRLLHD